MDNPIDLEPVIRLFQMDSDPFKRAKILREYQREKQVKLTELSVALKVKSAYLCHLLRLNKLPEIIIDGYYSDLLTVSHLFIISRLHDSEQMIKAYEEVLGQSLNILQTEEYVREILHGVKTSGEYISPDEKKLLIDAIKKGDEKIDIKIIQTRIKNKIIIEIKGNVTETWPKMKILLGKMG